MLFSALEAPHLWKTCPKLIAMEASQNRSDAESANNENNGETASHQKQRVRQYDLRDAPPIVRAENETELKKKIVDVGVGACDGRSGSSWDVFVTSMAMYPIHLFGGT